MNAVIERDVAHRIKRRGMPHGVVFDEDNRRARGNGRRTCVRILFFRGGVTKFNRAPRRVYSQSAAAGDQSREILLAACVGTQRKGLAILHINTEQTVNQIKCTARSIRVCIEGKNVVKVPMSRRNINPILRDG